MRSDKDELRFLPSALLAPTHFLGDRKPRTIPTKDLPDQVVFGGDDVRIVGT